MLIQLQGRQAHVVFMTTEDCREMAYLQVGTPTPHWAWPGAFSRAHDASSSVLSFSGEWGELKRRCYSVRIKSGLLLRLECKGGSCPDCLCPYLAALHLDMPGTCSPLSARTFFSLNLGLPKLVRRDCERLFYSLPELMWEVVLTNLIRIDEHGDIKKKKKYSTNLQIHDLTVSAEKPSYCRIKKVLSASLPHSETDSSIETAANSAQTDAVIPTSIKTIRGVVGIFFFCRERECTFFLYGNN